MDDELSIYYYWTTHKVMEDGSLFMVTSVYGPGYHSSGKFRVAPDDPDFDFWIWLINNKKPMHRTDKREYGRVHSRELDALRQEYRSQADTLV